MGDDLPLSGSRCRCTGRSVRPQGLPELACPPVESGQQATRRRWVARDARWAGPACRAHTSDTARSRVGGRRRASDRQLRLLFTLDARSTRPILEDAASPGCHSGLRRDGGPPEQRGDQSAQSSRRGASALQTSATFAVVDRGGLRVTRCDSRSRRRGCCRTRPPRRSWRSCVAPSPGSPGWGPLRRWRAVRGRYGRTSSCSRTPAVRGSILVFDAVNDQYIELSSTNCASSTARPCSRRSGRCPTPHLAVLMILDAAVTHR